MDVALAPHPPPAHPPLQLKERVQCIYPLALAPEEVQGDLRASLRLLAEAAPAAAVAAARAVAAAVGVSLPAERRTVAMEEVTAPEAAEPGPAAAETAAADVGTTVAHADTAAQAAVPAAAEAVAATASAEAATDAAPAPSAASALATHAPGAPVASNDAGNDALWRRWLVASCASLCGLRVAAPPAAPARWRIVSARPVARPLRVASAVTSASRAGTRGVDACQAALRALQALLASRARDAAPAPAYLLQLAAHHAARKASALTGLYSADPDCAPAAPSVLRRAVVMLEAAAAGASVEVALVRRGRDGAAAAAAAAALCVLTDLCVRALPPATRSFARSWACCWSAARWTRPPSRWRRRAPSCSAVSRRWTRDWRTC